MHHMLATCFALVTPVSAHNLHKAKAHSFYLKLRRSLFIPLKSNIRTE
jgi:hypothetical protein